MDVNNDFDQHQLVEHLINKLDLVNRLTNNWKDEIENLRKQVVGEVNLTKNLEDPIVQEHNRNSVTCGNDTENLEQQTMLLKVLENKEAGLKQDIVNIELKYNNLKKSETDKIEAQNTVLQKYRDLCKVSKELTRTVFHYQSSNVTGVIMNQNGTSKAFNLNPKEKSAKDITKYLWKCMAMASGEDWTSVVLKK